MIFRTDKNLVVNPTQGLYKWSKIFNRLQRNFFEGDFELRRERQIKDFLMLNGYKHVHYISDTDVFQNENNVDIHHAEIVVLTDQKFSRYPCPIIIQKITNLITNLPLYICLNRHYINIDNSYHDFTLDENFPIAITQWLKNSLEADVIDLSLNYIDYGNAFTWAVPDRHYYIRRKNAQTY
jgi:hypothetical protein